MGKKKKGSKKKKSRGKKSKRGSSPKAKYSLLLHGGSIIGAYKVGVADLNGQVIYKRLRGAITDPAQRRALANAITGGQGLDIVIANTRVAQAGIAAELMRHWKPTRPLVAMADKTVRCVLGKKFRA